MSLTEPPNDGEEAAAAGEEDAIVAGDGDAVVVGVLGSATSHNCNVLPEDDDTGATSGKAKAGVGGGRAGRVAPGQDKAASWFSDA